MARMIRVTINWTGFAGAPGFTNLTFAPAAGPDITQSVVDDALAKTDVWLNTIASSIANTVTLQVDPTVEEFEDSTGTLTAFWTGTVEAAQNGASIGSYSASSGAVVNWYTGGIRNGRRVRGRSFLVPVGGQTLAPNGSLDDTRLAAMRTATGVLIANTDDAKLAVWSRPSGPDATDGISYDVNAYTIPDKAAVLRSRRD